MAVVDHPAALSPDLLRWRQPNFLLIVCVAIAAWLVLVPVAALLVTAFTEDTGMGFGAFTLDNFVDAYSSARILRLFANSLVYALGTAAVTFVIGGFVAWAVERTDAPGGALFHNLALLSFAIPGLLMAMAWIFVLSPNIGWVNAVAKSAFGLRAAPLNIYTMAGMIWALSSHYFPLAYLALGPALRALDVRMEEAGLMSGGRYWQVLPKITLPLLRPAILSGLLLLFIMGLSSYEVPRLIGRPARIDVFTTEIQGATNATPPEFGVASALSLTLLVVCIVAVYFYRRSTRNAEAFATITGKGYRPTRIELGRWRWPVSGAIGLIFLVALGLPLFTLAWQSFFRNLSQPFMGAAVPVTLENYRFILRYPVFLDAVRTSVVVSAMAASFVVALTLAMAWLARRSASRFAWLLDALASAPIAIPSVIVGASVLFTYLIVPIPVYNTIWILLIAYVTLCLPYGMRFASSGITQIHRELEEAAAVSGASLQQIFLRVLLPLILPFLLAGWIYVFVLSVRELGASVFLVGPGTSVLGTVSLTMWEEGGSYGAVAALGILQILPLLLIVAGLRWLEMRVQRRGQDTSPRVRGEVERSEGEGASPRF
ncbi:MAG TPA: iron ABC transporter permease [Xanthobacteraceae bacterium]|nr:iron ABC transporter permease [Xanthobacteraceae bacterium]